jgi:hypothetical protein
MKLRPLKKTEVFTEFPCIWISDLNFVEGKIQIFSCINIHFAAHLAAPLTRMPGAEAPLALPCYTDELFGTFF